MKKMLVLCTGNSFRSQIAEGYLRQFTGAKAEIFSAGIEAHGLNPAAIPLMKEDGLDISHQTSNLVSEYLENDFDFIITVCDNAKENCPYFPSNAIMVHRDFPDPTKSGKSFEEDPDLYRTVRDEIKVFCEKFVKDFVIESNK